MVDRLSGDRTNVFPFAGQAAAIVKVINILNLVAKKEPGKKKFCMSASDLGLFALMIGHLYRTGQSHGMHS